MIHVQPQPEPPDFDSKVRQPGQSDLASTEGELRPHWQHCALQLWDAYRGVCAYSSLYIPRGTGARSVDHLLPKSKHRELTYEWSNYRLACVRMNARKNALERVLDPFEVQDGWFALELSTLQVIPAEGLPEDLRQRVEETIELLDLNDDEFIQAGRRTTKSSRAERCSSASSGSTSLSLPWNSSARASCVRGPEPASRRCVTPAARTPR